MSGFNSLTGVFSYTPHLGVGREHGIQHSEHFTYMLTKLIIIFLFSIFFINGMVQVGIIRTDYISNFYNVIYLIMKKFNWQDNTKIWLCISKIFYTKKIDKIFTSIISPILVFQS